MKRNPVNIGYKYGRWTVLKLADVEGRQFNREGLIYYPVKYYTCKCDCGVIRDVKGYNLQSGSSLSCGCLTQDNSNKTRRKYNVPNYFYNIWYKLVSRCINEFDPQFKYYGARGIKVCSFIKKSPDNLISLIGERKTTYYTIERLDNDLGYYCGSCDECKLNNWNLNIDWRTYKEQASNKRPTFLTINGVTKHCYEWALEYKKFLENQFNIDYDI